MNREKIVHYLDKQFWKHKVYECMPENETGYEYIPTEALYKIVDGLIPMIKTELKNSSIPDVSGRSEQLLAFARWLDEETVAGLLAEPEYYVKRYLSQ
jgi:hypothetical protein